MFDYSLNIAGSEWMIIIFVAIVLILGTGKLPGAAKKLGKAVNEYNKANLGGKALSLMEAEKWELTAEEGLRCKFCMTPCS